LLKNKNEINRKRREWYQKNKEEILRKRSFIDFRILGCLRSRLREVLFIQKAPKADRTLILVGCSIKRLKKHLESRFLDGMSWDNYGYNGWHMDHIRPCASFNLKDEKCQRKCFHYSNLQPLWATDNSSKGSLHNGRRIRKKND